MTQYFLARAFSPEQLEEIVNEQLKAGWQLHGGLVYAPSEGGNPNIRRTLIQAMVKHLTDSAAPV